MDDPRTRVAIAHLRGDLMLVGNQESLGHRGITSENAFNRAGRASARLAEERCPALFSFCRSFFAGGVSGRNRGQKRSHHARKRQKTQCAQDDIAPRERDEQDQACRNESSRAKAGEPGEKRGSKTEVCGGDERQ